VVGLSNETVDELVDEEVGRWLASDAVPEVFARRVSEVCDLPRAEYEQLCRNVRRRVAHLDWSRIQEMTIGAYSELFSERIVDEKKQVAKIIALIPSKGVRETLTERVARFNRTIQEKVHPHSRLDLFSMIKEAKHISASTWLYVGLTRFVSSVISLISRPVNSLKGLRAEDTG
jgi:hypothetical protein